MNELCGTVCSCALSDGQMLIQGRYYRYENHKRIPASGRLSVSISDVLRVGFTKTYSKRMFLFPVVFGCLALIIKSIPSISVDMDVLDTFSITLITIWALPFQDVLWEACGVLCLLTIPLYWLSRRNDLEINTIEGRFLLPCTGMTDEQIADFQQQFTKQKAECCITKRA